MVMTVALASARVEVAGMVVVVVVVAHGLGFRV